MPAGRKRKPTARHELEGTARADRMNPDEPTPSEELPVAPRGLSRAEKVHFNTIVDRLHELGYASKSHTETILTLARRLAEADVYSRTLNKKGYSYESMTESGGVIVRMRPEVAARSEAMRHAQSLLAELGLTPASSAKVTKPKRTPKKKANAFTGLTLAS